MTKWPWKILDSFVEPFPERIKVPNLSSDAPPCLAVKFSVDESHGARISGGPLSDSYLLNQFHIHWGSEKGRGSEHTLDGEQFDAEIHLVHYNENYDNLSHALAANESNSLAVLGVFVREVEMWDQYTEVVGRSALSHSWSIPLFGLVRPTQHSAELTPD